MNARILSIEEVDQGISSAGVLLSASGCEALRAGGGPDEIETPTNPSSFAEQVEQRLLASSRTGST